MRVTLRPDVAVLLFMLLWVVGLAELEFSELLAYWEPWLAGEALPSPSLSLGVPGLMLIADYSLAGIGFRLEAAVAERFLLHLFAHRRWQATKLARAWPWVAALAALIWAV